MFTSATFHFLFNAGRNRIFDGRGLSWRIILSGFPLLVASQVSGLSLSDHRNFLSDVVVGAVIGIFIGWLFYRLYFPSVFDIKNGGKAYPPRRFGIPFYFGKNTQFYPFEHEMVVQVPGKNCSTSFGPDISQLPNLQPCSNVYPAAPQVLMPTPAPKVVINVRKHGATQVNPNGVQVPENVAFSEEAGHCLVPMTPLPSKYPYAN